MANLLLATLDRLFCQHRLLVTCWEFFQVLEA